MEELSLSSKKATVWLLIQGIVLITEGGLAYGACFDNAVGVSSLSIIPGGFITASTARSSSHQPYYGRLNGDRGDGWCAKLDDNTPYDWLQIDFGKVIEVCGVATQGDINSNEWPIEFKLHFSSDGNNFKRYKDGNGAKMNVWKLKVWKMARSLTSKLLHLLNGMSLRPLSMEDFTFKNRFL
ncbi:contactin-associated protein-like 5 [Oculina patagonica]